MKLLIQIRKSVAGSPLVLGGLGIVLCAGAAIIYPGQAGNSSGSGTTASETKLAKTTPPSSVAHAPVWATDDQEAPAPIRQPTPSERVRHFQDLLSSGNLSGALAAMTAWADADPVAAAAYTGRMNPGPQRDRLLTEVAQRWAMHDTAAALAWVAQIGTPDERTRLVSDICLQIGKIDPRAGITLAERSGFSGGYASVKGSLAEQWAAQDPSSAMQWALSQPAGDDRNQFVAEVASVQARTSPVEATRMVIREIPPGPEQDNAILATLDAWAHQDLAGAAAWVDQMPSDDSLGERARAVLKASQLKQAP